MTVTVTSSSDRKVFLSALISKSQSSRKVEATIHLRCNVCFDSLLIRLKPSLFQATGYNRIERDREGQDPNLGDCLAMLAQAESVSNHLNPYRPCETPIGSLWYKNEPPRSTEERQADFAAILLCIPVFIQIEGAGDEA